MPSRRSLLATLLVPIVGAAMLAAAPAPASPASAIGDGSGGSAGSGGACAGAKPPGRGWELIWHDEFGSPRLDRRKWNTVMDFPGRQGGHYHNSSYGSYAVDENIVLRKGKLHLIANDEPIVGDDPPGTYAYTEGFMSSHDKFFHTYGYWEICAKYPAGRGLWPAFWLVPQDRTWPPEFDIAEWFGGIDGMFQGIASGSWPDVQWNGQWTYDPAPTTGWHTYALLWEPGRAVFLIDGKPTGEFTGDYVPDKAMYVVLNSGVWMNADRGGPPDATTPFPNSFDVEYVRVYDHHE
jgi:beta-glucanase (GH16 family)